MITLLYVLGQTAGWFACIYGAAHDRHGLAVLVVGALLCMHLVVRANRSVLRILTVVLVSLLFGFAFDSLLIVCGLYVPIRWIMPAPLATIWLMALWVNFALIVDIPLRWLQQHLGMAALLGGIFGPSAYLAGQRLGAIRIEEPTRWNVALMSLAWALGLALLMFVARLLPVRLPCRKTRPER